MTRVSKKKSIGGIITIDEPEDIESAEEVKSTDVITSAIISSQESQNTQNVRQASNPLFRGVMTLTSSEERGIRQDLSELGSFICAMQQEHLDPNEMKDCLTLHYDFLLEAKENSGKNPFPTKIT